MKTISKQQVRQKTVSNVLASLRIEKLQPSAEVVLGSAGRAYVRVHLGQADPLKRHRFAPVEFRVGPKRAQPRLVVRRIDARHRA